MHVLLFKKKNNIIINVITYSMLNNYYNELQKHFTQIIKDILIKNNKDLKMNVYKEILKKGFFECGSDSVGVINGYTYI